MSDAAIIALIMGLLGSGGLAGYYGPKLIRRSAQEANANQKARDEDEAINRFIDQLQEERVQDLADKNAMRAEMAAMRAEMAALRDETAATRQRERQLLEHVGALRRHILEGKPAPPPEMPAELRDL